MACDRDHPRRVVRLTCSEANATLPSTASAWPHVLRQPLAGHGPHQVPVQIHSLLDAPLSLLATTFVVTHEARSCPIGFASTGLLARTAADAWARPPRCAGSSGASPGQCAGDPPWSFEQHRPHGPGPSCRSHPRLRVPASGDARRSTARGLHRSLGRTVRRHRLSSLTP